MFLLFTFVAFGSGLIWQGIGAVSGPALLFATIALLIRSVVLGIALAGMNLDAKSRTLIVWFGPRGLSSLLLVLLPVFAGLSGATALFPICALVVLLSVVVHGAMLPILVRRLGPFASLGAAPAGEEITKKRETKGRDPEARSLPVVERPPSKERITLTELQRLWDQGAPVTLLDVRTERTYREDDLQARGALRMSPDQPRIVAAELALPKHDWLVGYCT
jgi:hypothetical protein